MTKAVFDALSDDEAFNLCFPGINDIETEEDADFDINKIPYALGFSKEGAKYG